jgi:hypothetical protein
MKKWYKSKTHWFNIGIGIIGALELNLHLLQDALGNTYGGIFIVVSIIGVLLRNATTQAVEK